MKKNTIILLLSFLSTIAYTQDSNKTHFFKNSHCTLEKSELVKFTGNHDKTPQGAIFETELHFNLPNPFTESEIKAGFGSFGVYIDSILSDYHYKIQPIGFGKIAFKGRKFGKLLLNLSVKDFHALSAKAKLDSTILLILQLTSKEGKEFIFEQNVSDIIKNQFLEEANQNDVSKFHFENSILIPYRVQETSLIMEDGALKLFDFIQRTDVYLKKNHKDSSYIEKKVSFNHKNFEEASVYWFWNENALDDWYSYNYRIDWIFNDGDTISKNWTKTNRAVVVIAPPFQLKACDIIISNKNIDFVEVQSSFKVGEKTLQKNLNISGTKKSIQTTISYLEDKTDPNFTSELRIVFKNGDVKKTDAMNCDEGVIFYSVE